MARLVKSFRDHALRRVEALRMQSAPEEPGLSDEWQEAYTDLVVEHFDRDMALLLLRLLEQPALLRDALEMFGGDEDDDGEEVTPA